MFENIIRLADLLTKDKLTSAERKEGINLAQAMFGSTASGHLDSVRVEIRKKAGVKPSDPSSAVSRNRNQKPNPKKAAGKPKTQPKNTTQPKADEKPVKTEGDVDVTKANEYSFKVDDVTFTKKADKNGKPLYRRSDKRGFIAEKEYNEALKHAKKAAGVVESE